MKSKKVITISDDVHRKLKLLAALKCCSISAIVNQMVKELDINTLVDEAKKGIS